MAHRGAKLFVMVVSLVAFSGCAEDPQKEIQRRLSAPIALPPAAQPIFGNFQPIAPPKFAEPRAMHPRDLEPGKPPVALAPHATAGRVNSLRFSPDATKLLATYENGVAELWNLAERKSVGKTTIKGRQAVRAADFAPDGGRILLADESGTLTIWDPAKPEPASTLDAYTASLTAVAWGADPRLVAFGSADGICGVMNLETGEKALSKPSWLTGEVKGEKRRINALAITPDCKRMFVGLAPLGSGVLDVDPFDVAIQDGQFDGSVVDAAISQSGRFVAIVTSEGRLVVKDLTPDEPQQDGQHWIHDFTSSFAAHPMSVVRFLPGDKQVLIYHGNEAFQYISVRNQLSTLHNETETPTATAIALSPDGRTAAYVEASGQIFLWELPPPVIPELAELGIRALDPEEPLEKASFEELEKLFAEERQRKTMDSRGYPELAVLYAKYSEVDRKPAFSREDRYQKKIGLLEKWRAQFPNSITPRLLLANTYREWAWVARGHGMAGSLSDEQVDLFRERNMKAAKVLVDTESLPDLDTEFYICQLNTGLGLGLPKEEALKIFENGVAHDPSYTTLYSTICNFLLPRWYGELGDIAELAERQYEAAGGGEEGLLRYALLAEHAVRIDGIAAVPAHRFSMPKLVQGMYLLSERQHAPRRQETAIAVMLLAKQRGRFQGFNPRVEQLDPGMWRDTDVRDHLLAWHMNKPRKIPHGQHIPACFSKINKIAYTQDDSRLLVAASDPYEALTLWDANTGVNRAVKFLPLSASLFDLSSDGKQMVLAGDSGGKGLALLWNGQVTDDRLEADDAEEIEVSSLKGHAKPVAAVAFSPDDEWVATAGYDPDIRLHNLRDEQESFELDTDGVVQGLHFSADSKQLAAVSAQNLFVWELKTREAVDTILDDDQDWEGVSRAGKTALIVDRRRGAVAYHFEKRQQRPFVANEKPDYSQFFTAAAVSPDQRLVAFGRRVNAGTDPSEKYWVDLWQAKPWKHLAKLGKAHLGEITSLAFTADSKRLASAAQDGSLAQWNLPEILGSTNAEANEQTEAATPK